jgi:hypothetical protein
MAFIINSGFDYAEDAIKVTATKTSTTDHDFKVTGSATWLTGGEIIYKNAVWGDYIEAQVIDIDNVLGLGVNTVLKQYITKKYLHPDLKRIDLTLDYAGKIPQNTYLRLKYHSVGTTNDVDFCINYHLHKEE